MIRVIPALSFANHASALSLPLLIFSAFRFGSWFSHRHILLVSKLALEGDRLDPSPLRARSPTFHFVAMEGAFALLALQHAFLDKAIACMLQIV